MPSKVYFADLRARSGRNILDKLRTLYDAAGLGGCVGEGDLVAVKLHAGEMGNLAVLRPPLVRTVVERVKETGGKPFLTDANTLYVGSRSNAVDHIQAAAASGYTVETVGAPFLVADGLLGKDAVSVKTPGELGEVKIAAALVQADALIVLTHFKCHDEAGFGGVLKNLGMGGASRAGKLVQHAQAKPEADAEICTGCRRCARYCPSGAISYDTEGKIRIDSGACIGCGECIITCNFGAISINWGASDKLQRRMVEHAAGLTLAKPGKCGYISFVIDVSPNCDCWTHNDAPIVPDIGMLASLDPVALDQACADLVKAAPSLLGSEKAEEMGAGKDKFRVLYPNADWTIQLKYAEELGVGTREYEMVKMT